jgi:hypothetical protein
MASGFALQVVGKPGYFIGKDLVLPSRMSDMIPVFFDEAAAEDYRWTRDALVVMASEVVEVEWNRSHE